ncbi:hypothetical protein V8C37DRAFT_185170 [Trichoderma ceciliae]
MSSLLKGATPTSIDTQLPTSTTFHNASSIANKPSDALPFSSLSTISRGPAQGPLTSSNVPLDVAPITQTPSTTASDPITKETVGNSPTPSTTDGSLTADGDAPKTTLPIPTSDEGQIAPPIPSTSIVPTSSFSLIPTLISSSTVAISPQLATATTVSSVAIPTIAYSTQIPSTITTLSQSQNQIPTPQVFSSSSPQVPPASGTEIGKGASSSPPARAPSSNIPSQAEPSAAHPTDTSVQGPEVFSAAAVAPSSESSTSTSTRITSSAVSIQGNSIASTQGQSEAAPSQPTNLAVSASGGDVAPNPPASTPISASSSKPPSPPSSAPASVPTSPPVSISVPTPKSAPTVAFSSPILSETPFDTITDVTSPTPYSTGGVGAFPTAINTLPGDLRQTGLPEGSQPTGQPIADPISSSPKPSTATIVGGTVGGIAAAAFIVILLWFWKRKGARGKANGSIEKPSFKPMAQKFGISTTLHTVKQNLDVKFASRNVNMNRGNSQFLEAVTVEPTTSMPTQNAAQNPATDSKKTKGRKLGFSFDHGRLFNPFSDANALMSGSVPPPSSSILSNPFADDNMVLPPPVSAANRRSRGRSLGGIRSFQAATVPPRPHSVHRESLQSNDSFSQRRDKFRSNPFDLELESRLVSSGNGPSSRSSSIYSNQIQQNNRDSYTSKYVSGSSLGDWAAGRRDSPTIS